MNKEETPAQAQNEQPIENLPLELIQHLRNLGKFNDFLNDYSSTISDNYLFIEKRISKIMSSLYVISDNLSEIIGEECRTRLYCSDCRQDLYVKKGKEVK